MGRLTTPALLLVLVPGACLSGSWIECSVQGDGTAGPYAIGAMGVVEDTETVVVDGQERCRLQDYFLDGATGTLTFSDTVQTGASIRVRVLKALLEISEDYRHRVLHAADPSTAQNTPAGDTRQSGPQTVLSLTRSGVQPGRRTASNSALTVAGYKTFGVSFGSEKGSSLDQTLSLDVSGRIGKDVDVTALLSDRHMPIQPEGNTRTLSELDKILLQVRSERLGVSLGDIDLSLHETILGAYNRRLKGLQANAHTSRIGGLQDPEKEDGRAHTSRIGGLEGPEGQDGRAHVTVVVASSEGKSARRTIGAVGGSQGPYKLTTDDGQEDIVVIAGTERVWLDGVLLRRGETDDYTIDYGRGQLFFTGRRLITSASRIIAEYQFADRRYQRQVAAVSGGAKLLSNRVSVGVSGIRESDVPDRPLDVDLSPEDRTILRQAGDNPLLAWRNEGEDSGSLQDAAGSLDRLVGKSSFSWIGQGKGDYRYVGAGRFEYVGPGLGAYLPGTQLPLPESRELAALAVGIAASRRFTIDSEAAVSMTDRNVISSRDDGDNVGHSHTIRSTVSPAGEDGSGFSLSAARKVVSKGFRPLGNSFGVEEQRRWGLDSQEDGFGESSAEATVGYALDRSTHLSLGLGSNHRDGLDVDVQSKRASVDAAFGLHNWPLLSYRQERIRANGLEAQTDSSRSRLIVRQQGSIQHSIAGFRPEVDIEVERGSPASRDATGTADAVGENGTQQTPITPARDYVDISARLSPSSEKRVSWETTWGLRREESGPGVHLTGFRQSHRALYRSETGAILAAEYGRLDGETGRTSSVARIGADFSPLEGVLSGNAHFESTSLSGASRQRTFLEVAGGNGDYRWEDRNKDGERDPEEFIRDTVGDYVLLVEDVGDVRPVREEKDDLWFRLDPGRRWRGPGALGQLSSETSISTHWRTTGATGLAGVDPLLFRFSDATLEGARSIEQTLNVLRRENWCSFRLRYRQSDDLDRASIEGMSLTHNTEGAVSTLILPSGHFKMEAEAAAARRERSGRGDFDFDIRSRTVTTRLTHRTASISDVSRGTEVRATLVASTETDRRLSPTTVVRWISVAPEVMRPVGGLGSVRLRAEWVHVGVAPRGAPLVLQLARGRREGRTAEWSADLDYRVRNRTTAALSYTGRKLPGTALTHGAQASLRASF